jgi:TPR repeat protein
LTLGHLFIQSVEQNDVKALLWYCKGADLGNAACACAAGDLYRRGSLPALPLTATTSAETVVPDLSKAIQYFEKGAAAGHALSMVYLATMLSRGQGVTKVCFVQCFHFLEFQSVMVVRIPQDEVRARELFRSGALQGDSLCMLGLARLLEDKSNELAQSSVQDSISNKNEALLWYQRASEAGCLAATEKLQELEQQ